MNGTKLSRLLAWVVLLAFSSVGTALAQETPRWVTETVDRAEDPDVRWVTSLALDAAGHPHIAYGWDHLYYARHDGSTWHLQTVDDSPEVGDFVSLALDAAGQPHISYYDRANEEIKYAYYDGAAWQIETVDSAGSEGQRGSTSIALDSDGSPHISYTSYDGRAGALKYAWYDGTTWQVGTVDSEGSGGRWPSLVLDSAGRPHVSYDLNSTLRYAHYDGRGWQIETVDREGMVGADSSLALDAAGRPHIACCSYGSGACSTLLYAYHDGTTWQTERLDGELGIGGSQPSLALDAAGRPHIASGGTVLHYLWHDGSGWQIEWVAGWAEDISLVLDAAGQPHLSTTSTTGGGYLRYIRRSIQLPLPDTGGPAVPVWAAGVAAALITAGLVLGRWARRRGV